MPLQNDLLCSRVERKICCLTYDRERPIPGRDKVSSKMFMVHYVLQLATHHGSRATPTSGTCYWQSTAKLQLQQEGQVHNGASSALASISEYGTLLSFWRSEFFNETS